MDDISSRTVKQTTRHLERLRTIIIMHKNTDKPLELGLDLDESSSFDLRELGLKLPNSDPLVGYRSVYRLAD